MNEPILLIMAAGMGSRFGGPKQIKPIGPHGEKLLDYSLYDAKKAGFKRVCFIIRKEIESDFREAVIDKIKGFDQVSVVFQEIPSDRKKPYGTGHAVLSAKSVLDAPFAVINADDFYGKGAYKVLYDFLKNQATRDTWCMVGYKVKDTLSENGSVSRGVCHAVSGNLKRVEEHTGVERKDSVIEAINANNETVTLKDDTVVSMNCWGFATEFLEYLEKGFQKFKTDELPSNPEKGEYYLPSAVQNCLNNGQANVRVLEGNAKWFGLTYPQDADAVAGALKDLTAKGEYPDAL